jgi:hypothetical protein
MAEAWVFTAKQALNSGVVGRQRELPRLCKAGGDYGRRAHAMLINNLGAASIEMLILTNDLLASSISDRITVIGPSCHDDRAGYAWVFDFGC